MIPFGTAGVRPAAIEGAHVKLLDLYCGAGGAAAGYRAAGFEVIGVDVVPQPRYAGTSFIQGDALELLLELGHTVDAVHASPPCQAYSAASPSVKQAAGAYPDLYAATRDLLNVIGKPYVIENVVGAPYASGVILCGSMFGLEVEGEWLRRHRNFETSWLSFQPEHRHRRDRPPITITGKCFLRVTRDVPRGRGTHSRQGTEELCRRLMGIDWMSKGELVQAIPPAYTRHIGGELRNLLQGRPTTSRAASEAELRYAWGDR